jgi:hypothetical protein
VRLEVVLENSLAERLEKRLVQVAQAYLAMTLSRSQ